MESIEDLEMTSRRAQLGQDLQALVEKYRKIFDWDVPEIDEVRADRLTLQAMRQALDAIEQKADRTSPP